MTGIFFFFYVPFPYILSGKDDSRNIELLIQDNISSPSY